MYGWDWGAVIPDMGIYGSIELRRDEYELFVDINEDFSEDYSSVKVSVSPALYSLITGKRAESNIGAEIIFNGESARAAVCEKAVFEVATI